MKIILKKKVKCQNHFLISGVKPITPQAILAPACPVVKESVCPPFPKSSSLSCTTQDLPIIDYSSPNNLIKLSVN